MYVLGQARRGNLRWNTIVVETKVGKYDLCTVEPRIGKSLIDDKDFVNEKVERIISCWNNAPIMLDLLKKVHAETETRAALLKEINDVVTEMEKLQQRR